jgi:hypothetical protein
MGFPEEFEIADLSNTNSGESTVLGFEHNFALKLLLVSDSRLHLLAAQECNGA